MVIGLKKWAALLALCSLGVAAVAGAADRVRVIDDFEHGLAPGWTTKSFAGETSYRVVDEAGDHVLAADSRDAASGLVYKISMNPASGRSWPGAGRWRSMARRRRPHQAGDDYPARVYVVFPSWFFPSTQVSQLHLGQQTSPGDGDPQPLRRQRHDDRRRERGEKGRPVGGGAAQHPRGLPAGLRQRSAAVGAVALMTDTDNTHSSVRAWYDDIRIEQP